jgi:Zn-dependent protease with chaperone function
MQSDHGAINLSQHHRHLVPSALTWYNEPVPRINPGFRSENRLSYYNRTIRPITVMAVSVAFLMLLSCASTSTTRSAKVVPETDPRYATLQPILSTLIAVADPERKDKYSAVIVESDAPNAWVGAGYRVTFTTAVFTYFNEIDILCIAAHEVSHKTLGHYGKRVGVSTAVTGAMMIADAFVPGLGYLNHVVNPAVSGAFSRSQEIDADVQAVEYLKRLNHTGEDYARTLEKLRDYAVSKKIDPNSAGIFSSHPALNERIEKVKSVK